MSTTQSTTNSLKEYKYKYRGSNGVGTVVISSDGLCTTYYNDQVPLTEMRECESKEFPDSIGVLTVFGVATCKEQIYRLDSEQYPDLFKVHDTLIQSAPNKTIISNPDMYSTIKIMLDPIIKPEWDGRICLQADYEAASSQRYVLYICRLWHLLLAI